MIEVQFSNAASVMLKCDNKTFYNYHKLHYNPIIPVYTRSAYFLAGWRLRCGPCPSSEAREGIELIDGRSDSVADEDASTDEDSVGFSIATAAGSSTAVVTSVEMCAFS